MPAYCEDAEPLRDVWTPMVIWVGVTPGALALFPSAEDPALDPTGWDPEVAVVPLAVLLEELQPATTSASTTTAATAAFRVAERISGLPPFGFSRCNHYRRLTSCQVTWRASDERPVQSGDAYERFPRRAATKAET